MGNYQMQVYKKGSPRGLACHRSHTSRADYCGLGFMGPGVQQPRCLLFIYDKALATEFLFACPGVSAKIGHHQVVNQMIIGPGKRAKTDSEPGEWLLRPLGCILLVVVFCL